MSVDKKEEIKSRFLKELEQCIEQFDAPKGLIPFIKKDGSTIHFSFSKSFDFQANKKLEKTLGNLYPYHDKRRELPLAAWGYIFNEENPKQPIFWPPSIEYFQQFVRIINELGLIGQFKKVESEVNGKKRSEILSKKLVTIRPANTLSDYPAPGED